jgi:hypothetical protein
LNHDPEVGLNETSFVALYVQGRFWGKPDINRQASGRTGWPIRYPALKLGITQSGVSNAMNRLEDRLGVQLLAGTTRRVNLTLDGAAFS